MRDVLVWREEHKLHRDGLNNLRRMFLSIVLAQQSEGVVRTYEGTSTRQYGIWRLRHAKSTLGTRNYGLTKKTAAAVL